MKKPLAVVIAVAVLVGLTVLVVRRKRISPEFEIVAPGTTQPLTHAPERAPLELHAKLSAPAFLYVLDETHDGASLAFIHSDAAPLDPGEFSSEFDIYGTPGPHHLVLFASPVPQMVAPWRTLETARAQCRACETAELTFTVDLPTGLPKPPAADLHQNER